MSTGEPAEVAERRIAGAEVVHGDPHTEHLELLEAPARQLVVRHQHGLGDLEHEHVRFDPGVLERRANVGDDVRMLELLDREIHGNGEVRCGLARRAQPRRMLAGLLQHPASQVDDQAHLLGQRDELPGLDEPSRRVMPADERLHAGHAAVVQPHDRLEVQLELAPFDRALQLRTQLEPFEDALVHRLLEDAIAARSVALADVHRGVGVADQLVGIAGRLIVVGAAEGDADARANRHVLAADRDRHLEPAHEALREVDRGRGVADVLDQDGELVPAEARGGVGRPHGSSRRTATCCSTSSPAAWPRLSLIVLKSSRSRKMTAILVPRARRGPARARPGRRTARGWGGRSRRRGTPGAPVAPRTPRARSRPGR